MAAFAVLNIITGLTSLIAAECLIAGSSTLRDVAIAITLLKSCSLSIILLWSTECVNLCLDKHIYSLICGIKTLCPDFCLHSLKDYLCVSGNIMVVYTEPKTNPTMMWSIDEMSNLKLTRLSVEVAQHCVKFSKAESFTFLFVHDFSTPQKPQIFLSPNPGTMLLHLVWCIDGHQLAVFTILHHINTTTMSPLAPVRIQIWS